MRTRERIADRSDACGVLIEHGCERFDSKLDTADCGGFEHRALLERQPGDVVVDDRREVLRNRHPLEQRRGGLIGAIERLARGEVGNQLRNEQRQSVSALVQRTHVGFSRGQ